MFAIFRVTETDRGKDCWADRDIRVCFECKADELFDLPVAFFLIGFQLLWNTREAPVKCGRRQVEAATINIGSFVIQAKCSGPDDAAKNDEALEIGGVWSARDFSVGVFEDGEFIATVGLFMAVGETDAVGVFG